MKVMKTLSLLVVINAIILGGCSFLTSSEDARNLAEEFLDNRFETGGVGNGQYYSDLFWKYTPQEDWDYMQVKKGVKMGDLSGTFVVFIYNTEYEHGNGQEKITLMKGFWDKDFQIIGHHFESPVFS
jgi:hypothetical protein